MDHSATVNAYRLDDDGRRAVSAALAPAGHPAPDQDRHPETFVVVVSGADRPDVDPAVIERVTESVLRVAAGRRDRALDTLVDFYLEGAGRAGIEQRLIDENARLRADFLRDIPTLTAQDVRRLVGGTGRNPSEPASRWKRERRVFAVAQNGVDLYPRFQFDAAGQPRSAVREVLASLPQSLGPWPTALWFVSGNGWLDGRTPADTLDEPKAVVLAAQRLAEPAVG